MRTLIVTCLLVPAVAAADGTYDSHMKAGDGLEAKSKWGEALVEFEAALAAKPNDAHALVEVGWTAYNANKLPRAKEASEAAVVAASADPQLRGAALFNLGLAWAKEDPFAAASLAFAGFALRPNDSVDAQVAKLEGGLGKSRAATAAGKKLMDKLHVADLPKPSRSGTYHAPADDVLVGAAQAAGGAFTGIGMSKEQLTVTKIACSEKTDATPHAFTCTLGRDGDKDLSVTGDAARTVALDLGHRKIKGVDDGHKNLRYTASVKCRIYDEMDNGSDLACEVK